MFDDLRYQDFIFFASVLPIEDAIGGVAESGTTKTIATTDEGIRVRDITTIGDGL